MTIDAVNATVVHNEAVAGCGFRLRVRPDAPLPRWEAGQFVRLAIPTEGVDLKKQARAFSVAGVDGELVEFYGVAVPEGALSPRLKAAAPGDRIWLEPKVQGQFTLANNPAGDELWLIGTGAGIAPFLAMLRHADLARFSAVVVVHQVRDPDQLAYAELITEKCRGDNRFRYVPIVSGEHRFSARCGHAALRGRVGAAVGPDALERATGLGFAPGRSVVMLCGNPGMIQAVRERLDADRGLKKHLKRSPGHIVTERYW